MAITSLRLVAVALASILGGWLVFDGLRALIVGDYLTPRSGSYAGRLGPWAQVLTAVGIDPRSPIIKGAHVVLGAAWLALADAIAVQSAWPRFSVLICAIATVWYLPFGTVVAIAQIMLSLVSRP